MQRSVKLCEFVSVSLTEHKSVFILWNRTSSAFKGLCLWFSPQLDSRWPQQDPAPGPVGLSPIIPTTSRHSRVCVCVTGICTDRNEHNYTLVSPQICRQPSTTENNKKNIIYLLSQLYTTQKTLMYTKIHSHTHSYSMSWDVHSQRLRFHETHSLHFSTLKETVHPNVKLLPLFTHSHVIQAILMVLNRV